MKLRQGWMHLVTLFTALVISSRQVNSQSLNYLITIPQTIRPGQELSVGVSLYGSRQYGPVMLNFGMERDGQELFTHKASVAVGETSSVVLPPLPLNSPTGHYQLNVMGVDDKGTTVFQNNTKISFNNRGLMTFVQTDKAIYKPGQTVKFRVFNLHPTLKHYRGQVDIVVEDPSGNRIQQWLSVSHPSGVVSKELPLCVQPPLGDWVISVTHKELEMKTKQTFTVAKYVLPKFEVNIQARSFVAQEEKLGVSGTIRAKYTYGKAVSGTAKVTLLCRVRGLCRLGIQCPYDRFRSREVKIVHSNIKVYGTVSFDFSYTEIISRTDGVFPWNMRIEAEVVEDLTGKNAESEMDIHVPNNRIKIEFFNTPNTFKPGLMYTAYVRVTQYDGSPLLAQDRKATLKVLMMQKDEWGTKNEEIKTFIIPLTGFVKMNSRVKPKTVSLSLKATFLSTTMQHYVTLERRSPSNSFVQVTTDSPSAQADVPMMFTIDGTNKTQNIMYQVLSRGNLVAAGQVTCENYQTQQQVVDKPLNQVACGTFRLLPQALWAPFSKLLVYYIREDGEVVNDGISFAVEGIFGNKVELEWSKLQAAPTDNVSLQVTTGEAQAYVGLVVVDKSVLLLKDGNDITQEKVISEVAQFGNYPIPFYGWGMPRLWLPGGNDAASVFLEAGVIVLTDLKVPTLNPIIYMKDHVLEGVPGAPPLKYTMLVEPGHVRTLFPETWIWDDAVTGTNLFAKFTATVPDTMTSWVASAFSLGPNLGLGLAQRQEMVAFQPFFISLDLPYSIIRGEQFILKVTIFNHLKENKRVLVTMEKSDSWDISTLHHVVDVPSKDGITVTFSLSPRRLGQVPITVKAQSNEAADAITKHLLVKAEGLPKTFSKALLIDVNSANVHSSVKFTFPPNVVAGSETAFVTATGDIMGPSIEGLGKLVKMPYGCGEQNMVNFAPNIYVLQYLDASQQDAKAIRRDALLYMAQGYQRELTFQRQDGSFSAFGDSDKSGSTWLSAFVLKCFTQARTHMYIDPHIVNKTSRWLKRQRISSGEYKEPGRLLDGHLLGSSSGPAALTGFVLIGLLSDPHIDRAACGVDTSMKYLERMLTNGIEDIQALAIVTYALTLSGSTRSATALDKLNTFAIQKDGLMYWPKTGQPPTRQQHQSSSSIETAAYALLAHLKLGRKEQGLPIMRWLGQQRNSFGGFTSTQDTVVALEAMSFFAAQVSGGKPNLLVSISTSDMSSPSKFIINENNLLVLHKTEVPVSQQHKTLVVNVEASGAGVAFIQLNVMYNIIPIPIKHVQEEAYEMNVIMKDNVEVSDHYSITICTSRKDEEKGGMVIMEVYLLSGFSPDDNFEKPRIARLMEVENGKVILYFDEIQEEICITISATRVVPVSQIKSACVIVYEYYHLELRAERVYNSPKIM